MVHIVIWSRNFPSHSMTSPYWSKPLKAPRPLSRQAPLHYLHTINISLHFCQVVIYRASLSSLCHLIWRHWLIYLCSFHMPLSEGHLISPQMLSISCTFAPRRSLFRLLFVLSGCSPSHPLTQWSRHFDGIMLHLETMTSINVNCDVEVTQKAAAAAVAISHVFLKILIIPALLLRWFSGPEEKSIA